MHNLLPICRLPGVGGRKGEFDIVVGPVVDTDAMVHGHILTEWMHGGVDSVLDELEAVVVGGGARLVAVGLFVTATGGRRRSVRTRTSVCRSRCWRSSFVHLVVLTWCSGTSHRDRLGPISDIHLQCACVWGPLCVPLTLRLPRCL